MHSSESQEESDNETKTSKSKLLNTKKAINDVEVLSFDLCPMERHLKQNAL